MDTAPRVLVAYATAAGSTGDIAERIAGTLRDGGAVVDCSPVSPHLDPAGFDAVVVGSAVHNMAWLPPAVEFLGRAARSGAPLWCFSVCGLQQPTGGGRMIRALAAGERRRVEQGFPAGTTPRDHRLFTGVVDMKGTPLWGRAFYRLTGGGSGDHRDWPAIDAWARGIGTELPRRRPAPVHPQD